MLGIPVCILLEDLSPCEVLVNFADPDAEVRGISPLPDPGAELHGDWLYICPSPEAAEFLRAGTPGVPLLLLDDGEASRAQVRQWTNAALIRTALSVREIFSSLQEIMIQIYSWHGSVLSAILGGGGLQEVMDLSSEFLRNYVAISDSSFCLLAYTKDIPCDDPICKLLRENGIHPSDTVRRFYQENRFDYWQQNEFYIDDSRIMSDCDLIGKVFQFQDTYFTHAVMTCNVKPASPGIVARYRIFLDCIGILIEKAWQKVESFTHVYDVFLSDIISGRLTDVSLIDKRSKLVQLPSGGVFLLANILADSESLSLPRLSRELASLFQNAKVTIYDGNIILLYMLSNSPQEEQMENLREELTRICREYNLRCGLSTTINHLSELRTAYYQAGAALNIAGRLQKSECPVKSFCVADTCYQFRDEQVYTYDDYFEYCALELSESSVAAIRKSRYFRSLLLLTRYDVAHRTNNLQLLRTYLLCERSLIATGKRMHMHRNNVAYRIGKIQELINIDLGDPDNRFRLLLAYLQFDILRGSLSAEIV